MCSQSKDPSQVQAEKDRYRSRKFNRLSETRASSSGFKPAYHSQSEHQEKFLEPQVEPIQKETILPALGLENYHVPFLDHQEAIQDLPEWEPEEETLTSEPDQPLPNASLEASSPSQRAHYQPAFQGSEEARPSFASSPFLEASSQPSAGTEPGEDQEVEDSFHPRTMPKPYPADQVAEDYRQVIAKTREIARRMVKTPKDYLLFDSLGG